MSKITCIALLIALSLAAKPGQTQNNGVAQPEVASQGQPSKPLVRELPLNEEAVKEMRQKLLDRGYFDEQPKVGAKPAHCAIPLLLNLLPEKDRFASITAPANPAIDPKIVSAPPLPACPVPGKTPATKSSEPADNAKPSERVVNGK